MQLNKFTYQSILVNIQNNFAVITLNRPDKKNAIHSTMLEELNSAITEIKKSQISALLLNSIGDVFCAGADLKERKTMSESQVFIFLDSFRNLLLEIENLPFPTICAIQGNAFGGGVEISLAFDIRYLSKKACLALTETKLGIIPGAGGTQRLPRLVGKSLAKEWIFSGEKIDADTALRTGLVNGIADPENFTDYVNQKLDNILSSAPLSLRFSKKAIEQGLQDPISMETALEIERSEYLKTLKTKDRIEALNAFSEKRKPVFKGE